MAATIQINYVDNELIVIASTPGVQLPGIPGVLPVRDAGGGEAPAAESERGPRGFSSTLAHVKSGYGATTPLTIYAQHILPPGNYTLQLIGVNWAGPGQFDVTVNGTPFKWTSSGSATVDTRTTTITV
jgi:hypothetical protein